MIFKLEHLIHQDELKKKLLAAGVQIPPTVFFYQDNGKMLVRSSPEQLALVEQLVRKLGMDIRQKTVRLTLNNSSNKSVTVD